MGKFITLSLSVCVTVLFVACGSKTVEKEEVKRPTLVEVKKKAMVTDPAPVKGKFLDYIFMISPDHKKEGYSINKTKLNEGYAYGRGPYDGWFIEFFLFRGADSDIVFEQVSGYEVNDKNKFHGFQITPYVFRDMKKSKAKVSDIFPVVFIDELYEKQIASMKQSARFKDWQFYELIKLPVKGTTVDLKVCKFNPEPPFATDTSCALIGQLKWNKLTFELAPTEGFVLSKEVI